MLFFVLLFLFYFKNNYGNRAGEDATKAIIAITRKYPLDVLNSSEYQLKDSYKLIFPSSFDYSYKKKEDDYSSL